MGPCPNPKACKQQGLFSPSPTPPSPSPSFSQQRSARLKTNKQQNVFRYRRPVPHQIRQMMMFFFRGLNLVSIPLSSPRSPALRSAIPKSHRLSPKTFSRCLARAAELRAGLWLGAAPTLPQHSSRRQSLQPCPSSSSSSSSSASPECQRPAPGRLPTRGTSRPPTPQLLLIAAGAQRAAWGWEGGGPEGAPVLGRPLLRWLGQA